MYLNVVAGHVLELNAKNLSYTVIAHLKKMFKV